MAQAWGMEQGPAGPLPEAGGRPPSKMALFTAYIWRAFITVVSCSDWLAYTSGVLRQMQPSELYSSLVSTSARVFRFSPFRPAIIFRKLFI